MKRGRASPPRCAGLERIALRAHNFCNKHYGFNCHCPRRERSRRPPPLQSGASSSDLLRFWGESFHFVALPGAFWRTLPLPFDPALSAHKSAAPKGDPNTHAAAAKNGEAFLSPSCPRKIPGVRSTKVRWPSPESGAGFPTRASPGPYRHQKKPRVSPGPFLVLDAVDLRSPLKTYSSKRRTITPERGLGSNQVDLGGILSPASAICMRSAMLVG